MKDGMREYLAAFQHRALVDLPGVEFSVRRTQKEPDCEAYVVRLRVSAGDQMYGTSRAVLDVEICGAHIKPVAFAIMHCEYAIKEMLRAGVPIDPSASPLSAARQSPRSAARAVDEPRRA